jgi:hypothetical protein
MLSIALQFQNHGTRKNKTGGLNAGLKERFLRLSALFNASVENMWKPVCNIMISFQNLAFFMVGRLPLPWGDKEGSVRETIGGFVQWR